MGVEEERSGSVNIGQSPPGSTMENSMKVLKKKGAVSIGNVFLQS